eukprot:CAMPEP_0181292608 /NCGR_PEP_ID=MMETSP1101-20121128/2601_1 /TAXON_ID=46948 /ORGANISM="Rhodomonas abbreviata, Strain Caron Lab Isolate" /LENGTH=172 /DNA_ID=CAMNT_0023397097 /DNA_START=386 /DNA_END=905 /DNA_ORIENTATION=+
MAGAGPSCTVRSQFSSAGREGLPGFRPLALLERMPEGGRQFQHLLVRLMDTLDAVHHSSAHPHCLPERFAQLAAREREDQWDSCTLCSVDDVFDFLVKASFTWPGLDVGRNNNDLGVLDPDAAMTSLNPDDMRLFVLAFTGSRALRRSWKTTNLLSSSSTILFSFSSKSWSQ